MIRWLHISDLHLGNEDLSTCTLREELPKFIATEGLQVDYIFITGDIRTAGPRYPGYNKDMADFILSLCAASGITADRLFIVPGNHDVDRDAEGRDKTIRKVMFDKKGYYDPHKGVINSDDLITIHSGQSEFRKFLSSLYPAERMKLYEDPENPHFVVETEHFNIIHVDSTVTYTKKQEASDLIVGGFHLLKALKSINKSKPSILLTHYPFTSLLQDEKKEISNLLRKQNVRTWLAGHEHDHNLLPHKYLHILQPGELRYEKDSNASILIGEYDPESFRCDVRVFRWYGEGWAAYPFVFLDSEDKERYSFELRPTEVTEKPNILSKTRTANRPYTDRLTNRIDRSLFPNICEQDGSDAADLKAILSRHWAEGRRITILLGAGGMGKSTMLLDHCLKTENPTLYISAEELGALDLKITDYCTTSILDNDDEGFLSVISKRHSSPDLTIIIDGLNEAAPETERRLIMEIKRLSLMPGIQMLIASRMDFTERLRINQADSRIFLKDLEENVLERYFSNEEWEEIRKSPNLLRLLRIPMMVTVYKEFCSVIDDFREMEFLDWRLPIETASDLFHNFYLSQIALMMRRENADIGKITAALACIRYVLPEIAYRFESSFSLSKRNGDFRKIMGETIANMAFDEESIDAAREFFRFHGNLNLSSETATDLLIDELGLLNRANGMTSFHHQMYRDYLCSRHIADKSRKDIDIEAIWNERMIPRPILRHIRHTVIKEKSFETVGNIKKHAEFRTDAATLLNNFLKCFFYGGVSLVSDLSRLDLRGITLPDLTRQKTPISLTDTTIDISTLGLYDTKPKRYHNLCLSPDSHYLAAASGKNIEIFDLKDNTQCLIHNIGKIPSKMVFYANYLLVNAGAIFVFRKDDSWRYVGSLISHTGSFFNANLKACVANGDCLHFHYKKINVTYDLRDCGIPQNRYGEFTKDSVAEGTSLLDLGRALDVRKNERIHEGVIASDSNNDLNADSYADGRIIVRIGNEVIAEFGDRKAILLDASISCDGSTAVTLSAETFGRKRKILIWDINGRCRKGELYCDAEIRKIHLSENARWIIGLTDSKGCWLFDLDSSAEEWMDKSFVSNQNNKLVTFGNDIICKDRSGRLEFFNLVTKTGKTIRKIARDISFVSMMPDNTLATVDRNNRSVSFESSRNDKTLQVSPGNHVIAIQPFKSHPFIAVADNTGMISIYHTGTGQRTRKLNDSYTVRLTAAHPSKTIIAHTDGKTSLHLEYFYETMEYGSPRGWWRSRTYKGEEKINNRILDMAFTAEDESLAVILSNGTILYVSEARCTYKSSSRIITAFNTDAYDFSGSKCDDKVKTILRENNCTI